MEQLESIINRGSEHVMHTYTRTPVCFVSGEGSRLTDSDGNTYLDMVAGIAVNNLGYRHPAVLSAIQEQADKLIHISNLYWNEPQIALASKLCGLSGLDKAFFCNSGAEANESAIKLARKWGSGRNHIITLERSFHGRTMGALTATGQPKYHQGFAPLPGGFSYVPANDLEAMKAAVQENTCAVLIEVVQGEGGVVPMTEDYLKGVQALCEEKNLLFMIDEVQTGFGRTGVAFAFQEYGLKPDVITLAKAIASGLPMGAMLAKDHAAQAFVPGDHASTFGGNPLSAHVGCTVADTICNEAFLKDVQEKGSYFRSQLDALKDRHPDAIVDVRGKGLMIGLECSNAVGPWVQTALAKGLVVGTAGAEVLRFVPPLIITKDEIDEAVAILEEVIQA